MDYVSIDKKWNKIWQETHLYDFKKDELDKKYYVLEMFSYPSGAKLHAGHWYNYSLSDSFARFMRMKGYNIFQPMGFDSFGLPAENYAIKTGIHPQDSTVKNIAIMEQQLKDMGAMFDWDAEVKTCMPDYYKWTQWMFLQLYKHGLAYRKAAPVNWCPSCNTVLANEQVNEGCCERCGATVVRKNLTQWFFKITDYSEELLSGLDKLDWPEKTKAMQRNWIGKSTGGEVEFSVCGTDKTFRVFTTRADTLFGVSYVVLAPELPLVDEITTPDCREAVEAYREQTSKTTEIERLSTNKEKTGAFTGAYAINPVNGEKVPVWIGDYVLASYGTGCVMGGAAHDERDYVFAKKHGLEIKRVIKAAKEGEDDSLPYVEYGILTNSGEFDGMSSKDAKTAIIKKLEEQGKGQLKTNYRLRDWLISRQRYWGAPIPVVYCDHCGIVPVPEKDLPVKLPYNVDFKPTGESPLKGCEEFVNTTCPVCGAPAKREVDTLDTFVCSSWYFLRYADSKNDKMPFDKEKVNKMLPVDKYIGGAEHACMHLLYARFFTKALRDMGYLDFDEPFLSLVHQGTILGPDGSKMSKSRGNVISPDDYVLTMGSDVFRLYLAFGFNYVEGGPWDDSGIKAIGKFLDRVERLVQLYLKHDNWTENYGAAEADLDYVRNNTIKSAENDYKIFSFNTVTARIMELANAVGKYLASDAPLNQKLLKDTVIDLLKVLAPLAPHVTEELWENIGMPYSIFNQPYPTVNQKALTRQTVELALQINSKIRDKIVVDSSLNREELEKTVLADEKTKALLEGKTVKKVIVVPGRLVNLIV
ncbi:MAG: leucine--tRNA ligase [Eubacteriales bacterium]|nr:leucine--tRNA ligase [Eubacteriales bacterium]